MRSLGNTRLTRVSEMVNAEKDDFEYFVCMRRTAYSAVSDSINRSNGKARLTITLRGRNGPPFPLIVVTDVWTTTSARS